MANSLTRKFPAGTKRITTGCQYCAVGCGYNAFLVPGRRFDGHRRCRGCVALHHPSDDRERTLQG